MYLISFLLFFIGVFKAIKTAKSNSVSKNVPSKLEYLSYITFLQRNYPERISIMKRLKINSQLLRELTCIIFGVLISLIYIMFEYKDYTALPVILTLAVIVATLYLYNQRKLLNIKKENLALISEKNNEVNKAGMNKLLYYSRELLIAHFSMYIAFMLMVVALIILLI